MGQRSSKVGNIPSEATAEERRRLQERLAGIEMRVRRRLHSKLRGLTRLGIELDDVCSSARRRLDEALVHHMLILPGTDPEFEALLYRAAYRVACDALRRNRRQRQLCGHVAARSRSRQPWRAESTFPELERLLQTLNEDDRERLRLWASGASHPSIARLFGVAFEAHRTRWRRLIARLRETRARLSHVEAG